jgi:hypothetical protein
MSPRFSEPRPHTAAFDTRAEPWLLQPAMKLLVVFVLFFWFICGLAGAWMLEGKDDMHIKTIARGPLTLIDAFNEHPVTYPG